MMSAEVDRLDAEIARLREDIDWCDARIVEHLGEIEALQFRRDLDAQELSYNEMWREDAERREQESVESS
ncbi:MAG: hypothetical protein H3C26_12375 [Rhodocyclaceae bacterium]|nr:hypothetical protein [Rhodocyclaceae bacterium]